MRGLLHRRKPGGGKRVRLRRSRREQRTRFLSLLYLSPSIIGVLVFFVIPFLVVIYYSMVNNPVQGRFVGLKNFAGVWNNEAFRQAGLNTLRFSFTAVPLAVVGSLLLAAIMESKIPFKSRFRTFFLSPIMVPIASVVLIWQVLFHYNGLVNEVFTLLGGTRIDWFKSTHAQIAVVLLFLWKNLGYNMILFMAALSSVPQDLIEVAQLEGASKLQIFLRIKLRFLSPTILFVTIMSLISSFKVFREVYLLAGAYPVSSLYMLQHYMNNTFRSLDYQKLSAAAIIMSGVIIVLFFIMYKAEDRFGRDVEE
ncbi:MAG: sugar ABC transporter permease [Lachnospiraceae bacterium]|nr:sugar ABC transporter permease [Lachnospiraceae bacterium]